MVNEKRKVIPEIRPSIQTLIKLENRLSEVFKHDIEGIEHFKDINSKFQNRITVITADDLNFNNNENLNKYLDFIKRFSEINDVCLFVNNIKKYQFNVL